MGFYWVFSLATSNYGHYIKLQMSNYTLAWKVFNVSHHLDCVLTLSPLGPVNPGWPWSPGAPYNYNYQIHYGQNNIYI